MRRRNNMQISNNMRFAVGVAPPHLQKTRDDNVYTANTFCLFLCVCSFLSPSFRVVAVKLRTFFFLRRQVNVCVDKRKTLSKPWRETM